MVKYFLIAFVTLLGVAYGQKNIVTNNFVTAKQGVSLEFNKPQHAYLHLGAEYFNTPKLSIVSETNIFLEASKKDHKELSRSHSLFTGINYHIINKGLDFYVGFQPGVNVSKRIPQINIQTKDVISPLVSLSTGVNYYSKYYFHFYTQLKYVYGTHLEETSVSLNGVRLTFGLGYNISQIYKVLKK